MPESGYCVGVMRSRRSRLRPTFFEQVSVAHAKSQAALDKALLLTDVPKNLIIESVSEKTVPYSRPMERRLRTR